MILTMKGHRMMYCPTCDSRVEARMRFQPIHPNTWTYETAVSDIRESLMKSFESLIDNATFKNGFAEYPLITSLEYLYMTRENVGTLWSCGTFGDEQNFTLFYYDFKEDEEISDVSYCDMWFDSDDE